MSFKVGDIVDARFGEFILTGAIVRGTPGFVVCDDDEILIYDWELETVGQIHSLPREGTVLSKAR